jgi:hypothetical protein
MSILEELDSCMKSDAPSYLEFLLRYKPKQKQIFAFYEGDEDSSYYKSFIEEYTQNEYEIEEIIAGCKNNVMKLQKEFDWEIYNRYQIAFFVDRDLSFWLNEVPIDIDNVFVTEGYSVENYLICEKIFMELLFNIKGFARAKKSEIKNMCKCFRDILPKFEERIMPVMAMAVFAKKRDKNIVLSEYKISKTLKFLIVDGEIEFNIENDDQIKEKWGICDITEDNILLQINKFKRYRDKYFVRGKWILYFMVELSEFMRKNFHSFAPSLADGREKLKATCGVEPSKSLPVLAPRCNITKEIKLFLDNTYGKYINSEELVRKVN